MTPDADVQRLEARVRGVVQGVGFRWFVTRHANRLGIAGWVANEADGSVSLVAEGQAAALDELAALLRDGPAGASVASVDERRLAATGMRGFGVRPAGHAGD
jgi:acylphosphatase